MLLDVDSRDFGVHSDMYKTYLQFLTIQKLRLTISLAVFIFLFFLYLLKVNTAYISPWDEMYHLSYIQYVFNWHLPVIGDTLNTWSQAGFNCRDVFPYGRTTPYSCGQFITDIVNYPEAGKNTAAIWPPVYYFVAAIWQHFFLHFIADPILSARIFSAFIWSLGFAFLTWESYSFHRKNLTMFILSILALGTFSASVYQAVFITPYSTLPMLIYGFLKIINRVQSQSYINTAFFIKIALFQFIAVLTVPHIIPCLIITLVAILIYADTSKRNFLLTFAVFSTSILITLTWQFLQKARATDLQDYQSLVDPARTVLASLSRIGSVFPQGILGYQFDSFGQILVATWFSYLIFSLWISILVSKSNKQEVRFFSISVVLLGSYSVFLDLFLKFAVPPRYGLSGFYLMSLLVLRHKLKSKWVLSFMALIALTSSYYFFMDKIFNS
jgi:hypothetical protein